MKLERAAYRLFLEHEGLADDESAALRFQSVDPDTGKTYRERWMVEVGKRLVEMIKRA